MRASHGPLRDETTPRRSTHACPMSLTNALNATRTCFGLGEVLSLQASCVRLAPSSPAPG